MEDKKHAINNEPGRRYSAGRVRPRGTMDIKTPEPIPATKISPLGTGKKRQVSTTKPAHPRPNRSLVLKRHIVERAVEHRKQVRYERKRNAIAVLIFVIVLGALTVLGWAFLDFVPTIHPSSWSFLHRNQHIETPVLKSASALDEVMPSINELKNFQAAADEPRLLKIPKLKIESRVKSVSASLNGEPISPSNIYDVGWFNDSFKPGQLGAVLLNGHVNGPTKNGVFHDLKTLVPQDEIQIERGDGITLKYTVVRVQTYSGDQLDLDLLLQSVEANKSGLNLMTSARNYDGGSLSMTDRTVVFAVQKK